MSGAYGGLYPPCVADFFVIKRNDWKTYIYAEKNPFFFSVFTL